MLSAGLLAQGRLRFRPRALPEGHFVLEVSLGIPKLGIRRLLLETMPWTMKESSNASVAILYVFLS